MNDKITLLAVLTVGTAFTFLWLMLCKERLRINGTPHCPSRCCIRFVVCCA